MIEVQTNTLSSMSYDELSRSNSYRAWCKKLVEPILFCKWERHFFRFFWSYGWLPMKQFYFPTAVSYIEREILCLFRKHSVYHHSLRNRFSLAIACPKGCYQWTINGVFSTSKQRHLWTFAYIPNPPAPQLATICLFQTVLESPFPEVQYYALPESHRGNQLLSYGGILRYTVRVGTPLSNALQAPDVIIKVGLFI